jgi:hypothetical protein
VKGALAQIFPKGANDFARFSIVLVKLLLIGGLVAGFVIYRSPVVSEVGIQKHQPVPFSHHRHVAGNGMDCRYCHSSVEDSYFANIPATETCMGCHSQILTDQPMFDPIHASWETGDPIEWVRIHDVPDFAYFNHSIHIAKGVGCETCHGRVDEMRLTFKVHNMTMQWCLDCHRAPEKYLRPQDEVYTMGYTPTDPETGEAISQLALGRRLVEEYDIKVGQLTNCTVCHR